MLRTLQQRTLGPLHVSAIGLGCMGFSAAYGGQDAAKSAATLHRAVELGVTLFDTAEVYGPYENEEIVGRALAPVRNRVSIATKFGFAIDTNGTASQPATGLDGSPVNARRVAEASLRRLGTDVIDLYYLHRPDPMVPIEESVGGMADLVTQGKVRAIGLSEISADQLRRAHAEHPIAALQSEYSLWERAVEREILPACRELGIGFVPFSPLGRGFLSGNIRSRADLETDDFRAGLPRFAEGNLEANLTLVDRLRAIASERSVTSAQLALAWVLNAGEYVVPIPGARKIVNLEANVAAIDIRLDEAERARISDALSGVRGARYGKREQTLMTGQHDEAN